MSQSHNTISINDISQSVPGAVFRWKTIAHPKHASARTLEDIAFFEGEHDAYDGCGCHHKRSVLSFGRELILIVDILKLEREISSFLLNMQCNAGDLLRLSDTLFRFVHGPSGSRHYIRIFDSGGVRGSVVAGEIYPDYGSAVPAPRIELTGHGIRDSLIVITALCADEALAGAMRYEPNGRFVAAGRGSTYALDIHSFDYSKKTGRVESALAAFAERGEGVVMCAQRARSVRDAAGNVRYDGGRDHDTFIAVGREGTFTMEIDAPPREFVLSYPIRSLVINGGSREFTQRDGLVTVSA